MNTIPNTVCPSSPTPSHTTPTSASTPSRRPSLRTRYRTRKLRVYTPEGDLFWGSPCSSTSTESIAPSVCFCTSSDPGVGPLVAWIRGHCSPLVSAGVHPWAHVISRAHIQTCKTEHRCLTVYLDYWLAPGDPYPAHRHGTFKWIHHNGKAALSARRQRGQDSLWRLVKAPDC